MERHQPEAAMSIATSIRTGNGDDVRRRVYALLDTSSQELGFLEARLSMNRDHCRDTIKPGALPVILIVILCTYDVMRGTSSTHWQNCHLRNSTTVYQRHRPQLQEMFNFKPIKPKNVAARKCAFLEDI